MNAPLPPGAIAIPATPLNEIIPSTTNPRKRFNPGFLKELAESIREHGVLQPITLRPNPRADLLAKYEIVVGEQRYRAAMLAGLTEIPALWRDIDDRTALELQVTENLHRRDVHPIEEAEGYEMLMKLYNFKAAEALADKVGKSRSYIYGRLKLLELCKSARESFFDDKVDTSTALLVARVPLEAQQKKLLKEITAGIDGKPMTFRTAKAHIEANYMIDLSHATFSLKDAKLVSNVGACTTCPLRTGNNQSLFGDVASPNVCTDPKCFNNKREARHLQLIEEYDKQQVKVIKAPAEVKKIFPYGTEYGVRDNNYCNLDAPVHADAEGRTVREILGKKATVAAVVEVVAGRPDQAVAVPEKKLVELGDTKTIEAALKKAGWKSQNEHSNPERGQRNVYEDKDAKVKDEWVATENAGRAALVGQTLHRLKDAIPALPGTVAALTRLLASAFLMREIETCDSDMQETLERHGFKADENDNDFAEQATKWLEPFIAGNPAAATLLLVADWLTVDERAVRTWDYPNREKIEPRTTIALAELVGLVPADIRKASVPPPAAQANGKAQTKKAAAPAKGKSAKAKPEKTKAETAPALPANETAEATAKGKRIAKIKAEILAAPASVGTAWPFPTASTPIAEQQPAKVGVGG